MSSDAEPSSERPSFPEGYGLPESSDGLLSWVGEVRDRARFWS